MDKKLLRKQLQQRLVPINAPSIALPQKLHENVPMPIIAPKEDLQHLQNFKLTLASVLVPIVMLENEFHIVLTKRSAHLKSHAGQVSFPGGKWHDEDGDLLDTALRESFEEIGLFAKEVDITGKLPAFATGTGFWVTAFVGLICRDRPWVKQTSEVETIFEVPLSHVLDFNNMKFETRTMLGVERQTYKLLHDTHDIWGATAYILHMLREALEQK